MSKQTEPSGGSELFEVVGAGHVAMCLKSVGLCGTAEGISLGVSWGSHGYAGGVMDVDEVRRLHASVGDWLETHGETARGTIAAWRKRHFADE